MTGKHFLSVQNMRFSLSIEIKRKFTFLVGDSGTGKSRFYQMLSSRELGIFVMLENIIVGSNSILT